MTPPALRRALPINAHAGQVWAFVFGALAWRHLKFGL